VAHFERRFEGVTVPITAGLFAPEMEASTKAVVERHLLGLQHKAGLLVCLHAAMLGVVPSCTHPCAPHSSVLPVFQFPVQFSFPIYCRRARHVVVHLRACIRVAAMDTQPRRPVDSADLLTV
jgi:hypothetical protein